MSSKSSISGKSTTTFGRAAPLPNEPGYGTNTTDVLERDTRAMEAQLQMLQLRMQQQAEDDANVPKFKDGSRWESARTDKGSATRYAKDVQAKHKRAEQRSIERRAEEGRRQIQAAASGIGAGAGINRVDSDFIGISNSKPIGVIPSISTLGSSGSQGRLNSQQMVGEMGNAPSRQAAIGSQGVFPPKNTGSNVLALPHVSQWGVSHVTTWLSQYLHLPQYIGVFTENEVTGSVVLELNLDDFDYMNITALGHRKTLLKAVEELRRTGHMSAPLPLPLPPSATPIAANNAQATHSGPMYAPRTLDPAVRAAQEREAAEAQKESDKKLVHWSALQPLQQQQEGRGIVGDESMLANSGDIDEEEEKRLFQAAVAEWRGLGKKETQSKSSPVTIIRDGKAVMRTRAVVPAVVDDSMWVNPFGPAPEPSSDLWEEPTAPVASKSGFATGTGSLLAASMADLDEAAEAKAFAAAVAEWRNGGTSASNNRRDLDVKTHGAAAGTETSTGMAVTTGTGKKVADALAQQLEKESEDLASAMATKLAEVRRKLEAAQQAKTTSASTVNHRSSPERDGVHSSITSRGYDSEEDNGGFGYNDSLDDDDDNEYAYHEGGKAEWRSDVRELNQNVSPTREELTRRARSLLQGQEEDMNQTYMQAMKLSTASAAGGKSVPSLSLSGNHADPTPTPFTVTEAPNSARIASARGMGTLSSLTPRGLLGGAPVIQLVATTPAKSGSTHGSPFGSGAAAEGALDVEGDCEEEGQQYYVVEEGSDDD